MIKKGLNINSSKSSYKISCDLYIPNSNNIKKIIIACHGFGGDKKSSTIISLANSLTCNNIGVIAFDFPGHGDSNTSGYDFRLENCINDINDVEKYIEEKFKNIEIGFFATSFGAYALLLKINRGEKLYKSVILRCPALDMKSIFERSILKISLGEFLKDGKCILGFERKIIITKEYYQELVRNNIFKIYNKSNDILIIHGTEDNIAPIDDSLRFQEMFKNNVKIYKVNGADHRFKKNGELEEVISVATKYILKS